jgi:uncharacterized protein (TIRG00374 family)
MNNVLAKNIPAKEIHTGKKRAGYILIKLTIAAGLIIFIIAKIKPDKILSAVASADYHLITLAFLLSFFNIYFQYLKWETVCRSYLNISSKKKIFISLFHGFAAGIFTPARIGEYFSRGLAIREKSIFQVAAATFIDKFFPLIVVSFFGGISFILYFSFNRIIPLYTSVPAFILLIILLTSLLYLLVNGKIASYIPPAVKQNKKIEKIFLHLEQLKKLDPGFIVRMIFISSLFYFCYLIQFAVLVAAFAHSFRFPEYLWNGSLIMFAKSFIPQVSFGELGIREGVSIYFYNKINVAASVSFNASFFLFLINLLFPSLIGMILLYKKNND